MVIFGAQKKNEDSTKIDFEIRDNWFRDRFYFISE